METDTHSRDQIEEQEAAVGADAFAARLKSAQQQRGFRSIRALAQAAGVHPTSMRSYLKGENDPSRESLVRIAAACGVSLEWLAAGRGEMLPGQMPSAVPGRPPTTFGTLNIDRMAEALEKALQLYADRGGRPRETRHLVQIMLLLYDELTGEDGQESR